MFYVKHKIELITECDEANVEVTTYVTKETLQEDASLNVFEYIFK